MQPLSGIKVLDLSRLLPGPFCSLLLADLGAQVDKIEEPNGGDYLRHMPPLVGSESGMFHALNRNKRSACIDLKSEAGKRAFLELAKTYDVILEQFRPGVLDRLGLGHKALQEHNPRLVICALTGYGQNGPLAKRAGHDINYLARAGLLGLQGPADAPPTPPGFQLADVGGGLWCAFGIVAALFDRSRTGRGTVLDISMMEAALPFAISSFGALFAGQPSQRGEDLLTGGIVAYNTYRTSDGGYMSLGALEPKFWMTFCQGAGIEVDMTAIVPGPHQADLKKKMVALFESRTRKEWEEFSRIHDCCLEPVLSPSEVTADSHVNARGLFFDLASPFGALKQWRTPLTEKDASHTSPPKLGEHTDAILREAGLNAGQIAELRAAKAIA